MSLEFKIANECKNSFFNDKEYAVYEISETDESKFSFDVSDLENLTYNQIKSYLQDSNKLVFTNNSNDTIKSADDTSVNTFLEIKFTVNKIAGERTLVAICKGEKLFASCYSSNGFNQQDVSFLFNLDEKKIEKAVNEESEIVSKFEKFSYSTQKLTPEVKIGDKGDFSKLHLKNNASSAMIDINSSYPSLAIGEIEISNQYADRYAYFTLDGITTNSSTSNFIFNTNELSQSENSASYFINAELANVEKTKNSMVFNSKEISANSADHIFLNDAYSTEVEDAKNSYLEGLKEATIKNSENTVIINSKNTNAISAKKTFIVNSDNVSACDIKQAIIINGNNNIMTGCSGSMQIGENQYTSANDVLSFGKLNSPDVDDKSITFSVGKSIAKVIDPLDEDYTRLNNVSLEDNAHIQMDGATEQTAALCIRSLTTKNATYRNLQNLYISPKALYVPNIETNGLVNKLEISSLSSLYKNYILTSADLVSNAVANTINAKQTDCETKITEIQEKNISSVIVWTDEKNKELVLKPLAMQTSSDEQKSLLEYVDTGIWDTDNTAVKSIIFVNLSTNDITINAVFSYADDAETFTKSKPITVKQNSAIRFMYDINLGVINLSNMDKE